MNRQDTTDNSPAARSRKMLRAMVGIGILCGLLIVLTYETTSPYIAANQASNLEQAIFRVIPGTQKTQTYTWTPNRGFHLVTAEANATDELVYAGYDRDGRLLGIAIPAHGQGYADVIRILYGYDPEEQTVIGFYVLESRETPGLGDKIEDDMAYREQFSALDVSLNAAGTAVAHPLRAVKAGQKSEPWEVDCISGATITSRAIVEMISKSTGQWAPRIQNHRTDFSKR